MTDCQETKPSPKKESADAPRPPPFNDDEGNDGDSPHKAKRARKVKEALIDHTYRDYSRVEVAATDEDDEDEEGEDQRHDQRRKEPLRASSNFPAKLHAILSNPSYQHIIRWMDKRTYYHECFLRGRPELTRLMQRLCNEGKRLPDKSGEPNLYEISKKYPLPELFPPLYAIVSVNHE
ncbi:hypothetical protein ACHAW5_006988 [Stephanodiscus triporus]|uniref:Uncharacterized protein n=1 Tax=Stephanodiscus triporus TaxID=2934178 RepID=A0ABD3P673_9STRA